MQEPITNIVKQEAQKQIKNNQILQLDNKNDILINKKKKKKYKKRKHSPQYYQQLRQTQLNQKREQKWNTRFIHDTIPQFQEEMRQHKRLFSVKKPIYKKQKLSKHPSRVYSTAKDQTTKSGAHKSFNIRVVSKKQKSYIDKQKEQNQKIKHQTQRNSLIQLVQNTHKEHPFIDCHKNMLIDLIKDTKNQLINKTINQQVQKLKNKSGIINSIRQKIEKREKMLKEMQQKQQIKQQSLKQYQSISLSIIEQILVWKQNWQNIYQNLTKIKKKLIYGQNGKNFILSMGNDCLKKNKQDPDDPFLLKQTKQQIDNQLIIRIRACELLLLQEKLHSQ